jgi:hypothetical protein
LSGAELPDFEQAEITSAAATASIDNVFLSFIKAFLFSEKNRCN